MNDIPVVPDEITKADETPVDGTNNDQPPGQNVNVHRTEREGREEE